MARQKNSSQMKEDKVMTRDLIKTDISNILDGEFKPIIKLITGFQKRTEDFREATTTEIKKKLKKTVRNEKYNN